MPHSHLPTPKRILVTVSSAAALGLAAACLVVVGAGAQTRTASNSNVRSPRDAPTAARRRVKSSSQLVSADPRAQYLVIKRTFEQFIDEIAIEGPDLNQYYIINCISGREYLGVSDKDPIGRLADLAYHVVYIENVLEFAGYPKSVWRAPLLELEKQELAFRLGRMRYKYSVAEYDLEEERIYVARKKILRAVIKHRAGGATRLPKIVEQDGCGAGEFVIKIRTVPAGGRVNIIPVFFYELCKAQRLNPDDSAQCDRWREPVEGVVTEVVGDYFYRVSWPDGARRSGRLSFTKLQPDQTVTFRKP
ncbi:MAG: hypothetical protein LC795_19935 [Acidobacteria bacterium]|nr:hypothetical protein [Acidobacteriota bacterium]